MSQSTAGVSKPVTTFVQADSSSFRDVVQRLTGQSMSPSVTAENDSPKTRPKPKLHERRQLHSQSKLQIIKPPIVSHQHFVTPPQNSNDQWKSLSPFSASSPMSSSKQGKRESSDDLDTAEEEKAIKERRFYLHPSPRSKSLGHSIEPELLTLFPLTSPNAHHTTDICKS